MLLILITGIFLILCIIITILSSIMSNKVIYNAYNRIRRKINDIYWKRIEDLTDEERMELKKLTKKEKLLDTLLLMIFSIKQLMRVSV